MPLEFIPHAVNTTFIGHKAVIIDEDKLVQWVASTLMAKHNHILKIISSSTDGSVTTAKDSVIQSIIKNILHAENDFHRDGLLFQHISWIFSVLKKGDKDIFNAPHCRVADKGQDSIAIHFDENNNVVGVSIYEDKATENVKSTIRDKVYPEFKDYEFGNRDSELESEVLAMLEKQFDTDQANSIIESVFWQNIKRYKINVTVNEEDPLKIFKGYDDCIPGKLERRTGNTVQIIGLRNWFDQFSQKLEVYLNSLIEA